MQEKPGSILKALSINPISITLSLLFLGGLFLTVSEIDIYRDTFVSSYVPTTIWLLVGLASTLTMRGLLEKYYNTTSFFLQLVFSVGSWGGIVVYMFMAANFYITSSEPTTEKWPIENHGTLAKSSYGCGEPYVDIIYDGVEKQLMFPCGTETGRYKFVQLTIQKGLWGFEVIKTKELLTR